ncbi:MAG TPA: hypothetical protein VE967_16060 [Gemmatimonadaceae bacterium]|nr:hypothetical protein [Gemmatimonadaceae bacterium]
MRLSILLRFGLLAPLLLAAPRLDAQTQRPLAPVTQSGQAVFPVFEGWYKNQDGTFSISFGYFNRNDKETIDIPIGTENAISPGPANQGQPTHFETRRHWGVFAVKVPADFGTKTVTWTLTVRGEKYAIPGSLRAEWQIDALEGEVGSGNTPPELRFAEDGPVARGPAGYTATLPPVSIRDSLQITVWEKDDGRSPAAALAAAVPAAAGAGRGGAGRGGGGRAGAGPQTSLVWFLHQGPGAVKFSTPTASVPAAGGTAKTWAKFSAPGEYILRVRATDSPVAGAGHAQCCWTNGFVRVIVNP